MQRERERERDFLYLARVMSFKQLLYMMFANLVRVFVVLFELYKYVEGKVCIFILLGLIMYTGSSWHMQFA